MRVDNSVLSALIGAAATIVAVIITSSVTRAQIRTQLETQLAVMKNEIGHLTEETKKHNNFAQRVPVLEEQVKVINHRLADLEKGA